jgi:hypothetical protein
MRTPFTCRTCQKGLATAGKRTQVPLLLPRSSTHTSGSPSPSFQTCTTPAGVTFPPCSPKVNLQCALDTRFSVKTTSFPACACAPRPSCNEGLDQGILRMECSALVGMRIAPGKSVKRNCQLAEMMAHSTSVEVRPGCWRMPYPAYSASG